jgi:hypothetical protein
MFGQIRTNKPVGISRPMKKVCFSSEKSLLPLREKSALAGGNTLARLLRAQGSEFHLRWSPYRRFH